MKKIFFISFLLLAACSDEQTASEQEGGVEESSDEQVIEVDKGLLNVEITIPSDYLADDSKEEIKAEAEEQGAKDVTFNDDGSVTYKLSKEDHDKALEVMKEDLNKMLDEMESSEDFASIKKIEANDDFTVFDMTVDKAKYEDGVDSFVTLGIMLSSSYYQIFEGKAEEEITLDFNLIDEATGEVYETEKYPESE